MLVAVGCEGERWLPGLWAVRYVCVCEWDVCAESCDVDMQRLISLWRGTGVCRGYRG